VVIGCPWDIGRDDGERRKGASELDEWRGSGNIPSVSESICGVVLIAFAFDIGPL
jgi:hypothetical protein